MVLGVWHWRTWKRGDSPRMVRELRARGFSASKAGPANARNGSKPATSGATWSRRTRNMAYLWVRSTCSLEISRRRRRIRFWHRDTPICGQIKAGCTLAIVRDLFNREIIDWSLKPRMQRISWSTRWDSGSGRGRPGLLHNFVVGSQYASYAF